jgi:hypothetical protein
MPTSARSKVFVGTEAFGVTEEPAAVAAALSGAAATDWIVLTAPSGGQITVSAGAVEGVTPSTLTSGPGLRSLLSVVRDATVIATLIVTILTLFPDLAPSTSQNATFKNVSVDRNVEFGAYLHRHLVSSLLDKGKIEQSKNYQPADGAVGAVVLFQLSSIGYRNKALPVRWTLYASGDNRVLAESEDHDALPIFLTPAKKEADIGSWEIWLDAGQCSRPCFVRLEVYDPDGNRVTYKDTPAFTQRSS